MKLISIKRLALLGILFTTLVGASQAQSVALIPGHVTACTSFSCTLAATSGTGNLLVVGVQLVNTGVTVASVTDNVGNVYTEAAGSHAVDTASNWASDIWYAKNSIAGATTITITTSGAVSGFATVIWEFSGADPSSPVDQAAALNSQASSSVSQSPSVTTTSASEAIVALSAGAGQITGISSGNVFTNDSTVLGRGWAHLVTTSAGSYLASWAANPAGTYASSAVSFKAAQSGATVSSCDINGDGSTNVVDVQLITNMEIGVSGFSCTANIGGVLGCTDAARQTVIKAALGSGCHFIYLTWSPSSSSGVVGYNIYRGTSPGGESPTRINAGGLVAGQSYTDLSTVSGTTYYYYIKASDGSVEGPASAEASATAQ